MARYSADINNSEDIAMINLSGDGGSQIYIKKSQVDQILLRKTTPAARLWRKIKQFLLLILFISILGSAVLFLFYVNMPNGYLTYLGYVAMAPLMIIFTALGFRFFKSDLFSQYDMGKEARRIIILSFSAVFSYAIMGHGFILYTYFCGIPHQSKPLKIISTGYRSASHHSGNRSVSVSGNYFYFQKGSVYPHTLIDGYGSNQFSGVISFFVKPRFYRDEFVTEDRGWLIDRFKTAVIYYKVTPFAVVATAIQGHPYFSDHFGKKHPLILFGINDTICYPFGLCVR